MTCHFCQGATSFPGSPPLPAIRSEEREEEEAGRGGDPGSEVGQGVEMLKPQSMRTKATVVEGIKPCCYQKKDLKSQQP